jgi:hypothetical protein
MRRLRFAASLLLLGACTVDDGAQKAYTGCTRNADCGSGARCDRGYCLPDPTACLEGDVIRCYEGPAGTEDVGVCHGGQRECVDGRLGSCLGQVTPSPEQACNNKNDDCDALTDEIDGTECQTARPGVCAAGILTCTRTGSTACVSITSSTAEICNDLDDDCDGQKDNILASLCYTSTVGCQPSADGAYRCLGSCRSGLRSRCVGGAPDCAGEQPPVREVCAPPSELALDENCDGHIDEGCPCMLGAVGPCYTGPTGTATVGSCHAGTHRCVQNAMGGVEFDECVDQALPADETCANLGADDNCNGVPDDISGLGDDCRDEGLRGECKKGKLACAGGGALSCLTQTATTERCNLLDDDCDGAVDNGFMTQTDAANCGACGRACGAGLSCCGGECVDRQTDRQSCGICGRACADGEECCQGECKRVDSDESNCGLCGRGCAPGATCCGGSCADTRTSTTHCGGCDRGCGGAQACCGSTCAPPNAPACTGCAMTCTGGATCCPPICTDRQTDPSNCGSCGRRCGPDQLCCAGDCVPVGPDHCGGCAACPNSGDQCCGGACRANDESNCQGCNVHCGGGEVCCESGCANLGSSGANCGACGRPCSAGFQCSAGLCCPVGEHNSDGICCDAGQSNVGGRCCPSGNRLCGGQCCGGVCLFGACVG